jgi:hypothetical protein
VSPSPGPTRGTGNLHWQCFGKARPRAEEGGVLPLLRAVAELAASEGPMMIPSPFKSPVVSESRPRLRTSHSRLSLKLIKYSESHSRPGCLFVLGAIWVYLAGLSEYLGNLQQWQGTSGFLPCAVRSHPPLSASFLSIAVKAEAWGRRRIPNFVSRYLKIRELEHSARAPSPATAPGRPPGKRPRRPRPGPAG